jgi:hypothetical protein
MPRVGCHGPDRRDPPLAAIGLDDNLIFEKEIKRMRRGAKDAEAKSASAVPLGVFGCR